jgi:hypothetical protein
MTAEFSLSLKKGLNIKPNMSLYTPWKHIKGVGVWLQVFLSSELVTGNNQHQAPAALPPWKGTHDAHCIGGWLDPRSGVDTLADRKILDLAGN